MFYFCGHHGADTSSEVLKTLILQIIAKSPDLVGIAYEHFVLKYAAPSLKALRDMLIGSKENLGMLHGIETCRILIDGVDECDEREQRFIIEDLLQLVCAKSTHNCKLLLCSRSIPAISKLLQKKSRSVVDIPLSAERTSINDSIQTLVKKRLRDIEEGHAMFQLDSDTIEELISIILDKADGRRVFILSPVVIDIVKG